MKYKYCSTSPREAWVLEAPDYYTVYAPRGRGKNIKIDNLPTLTAAFIARNKIPPDPYGRGVLIYAVRGTSQALVT